MRHPKLIIAGIGVALAAAGGHRRGDHEATPGIAPIAASATSAGTVPAAPSSAGYGGY